MSLKIRLFSYKLKYKMDYSQHSKIDLQVTNNTYMTERAPVDYYANQLPSVTSSNQIPQNVVQNGFREQQIISNPFFTSWEQAGVGQTPPPLLDAYGVPVSSSRAYYVSNRSELLEQCNDPVLEVIRLQWSNI